MIRGTLNPTRSFAVIAGVIVLVILIAVFSRG